MPGRSRLQREAAAFTVEGLQRPPLEFRHGYWWAEIDGRELRLSNLDKVFWPQTGCTKGDLVAYYFTAADRILPYLRDRPLTLKRMPDGAAGGHFFEKDAPEYTPRWMPRCHVPDFEGDSFNDFLMANDTAGLLFVANLGCIEFHPLHSRCATVSAPDYLFFDLDPFEPATFDDAVAVAFHVRTALDTLGLPSYPKTSGATGVQVYVPVQPGPGYEETRAFVERIGRTILTADPDRVTMEWPISRRTGKVFIDHNMNRRGANMVAPYSLRPTLRATISMPVRWDDLEAGARPEDFRIDNASECLERQDPFAGMVTEPVDVRPAMEAVGVKVAP